MKFCIMTFKVLLLSGLDSISGFPYESSSHMLYKILYIVVNLTEFTELFWTKFKTWLKNTKNKAWKLTSSPLNLHTIN